jgi:hypothetical protein
MELEITKPQLLGKVKCAQLIFGRHNDFRNKNILLIKVLIIEMGGRLGDGWGTVGRRLGDGWGTVGGRLGDGGGDGSGWDADRIEIFTVIKKQCFFSNSASCGRSTVGLTGSILEL